MFDGRKSAVDGEQYLHLFEGSLGEQVTFDPGQGLMRIVICLFYQPKFLPLTLVQTRLHTKQQHHKAKM